MKYTLIFYYSQEPQEDATRIETKYGAHYVRVIVYRGGRDPLDWAEEQKRAGETLLNTIEVSK